MAKMDKPGYTIFSFAVSDSNLELYNQNLNELKRYIQKKKRVPFSLLGIHFMIQFPIGYVKNDERTAKAITAANKASEYFKNYASRVYQFEGTKKVKDGKRDALVTYSLNELLFYCTGKYYELLDTGKIKEEKDDTVRFFYNQIRQYKNEFVGKSHESQFNSYKTTVMAGYLSMGVGFKVCNKKNFTNKELFQSSRYALKKIGKLNLQSDTSELQ